MANHSSAKKAIRQIKTRTERNKSRSSRIKTYIKKVLASVAGGDAGAAQNALSVAQSEIMKGVKAGILKLNTASRKVSKLSAKVKKLVQGA